MSLKRRNVIAWILLLFAVFAWFFGQWLLEERNNGGQIETSLSAATNTQNNSTIHPTSTAVTDSNGEPADPDKISATNPSGEGAPKAAQQASRVRKMLGMTLCFLAVGAAAAAVFVLRQKAPVFGPDGIFLLLALLLMACLVWWNVNFTTGLNIVIGFSFSVGVRELWGWISAKLPLSWCLIHRITKRCAVPQLSLLSMVGWILIALAGIVDHLFFYQEFGMIYYIPFFSFLIAAVLGFLCLWKYGSDLDHFRKQLNCYQQGLPITVGNGAFSQTEAQLLEMRQQHDEAIEAAVKSERFKVELISNVSHDLRTPLTAILGYSELLQQEQLSEAGSVQLQNLQQKSGYMKELVESLFELTKVSSGILPGKQERIDLIRLLEQTVGLFEDQLSAEGLQVRRHYEPETATVITDGARMHQVFANLLGNAMKYALCGTRIHLELKEEADSFRVRMVNTASYEMDFAPDEIMQRFARGDKARSTKGSGLGLAIAQTYTASVGGSFRVSIDGDQFAAIVTLPKNDRDL